MNLNGKKLSITLISNITKNVYLPKDIDNTFITFNSKNNILHLIYSIQLKSIISYNLNKFQIITEIKNPHENNYITNFRHFLDKKNYRDLVMSISYKNCNIKIWNNENWNCVLNLKNIYSNGIINSGCFISYLNEILICAGNNYWIKPDYIKIFDIDGKLIKNINNSKTNSYYIDCYYDKQFSDIYIISCCYEYVLSFNYIKNEEYHKYFESNSKYHTSCKILENEGIIKLIDSAGDGIIRIWNFHSGVLINKIYVTNLSLYGICLWENDKLFIGCSDNNIKLININNGNILKNIKGSNNWVCTVNVVNHEKYKNCLISQSIKDEQIKLWMIKIGNE